MSGMFIKAHDTITNGIAAVLGGQSDIYGDMIAPSIIAWMTLYISISGYKALAGKLQTPLSDVIWNLGVTGILLAFVTNANGWFATVSDAITGVSSGLAGEAGSIWGLLDTLWDKTQVLAEVLYQSDEDFIRLSGWTAKILAWAGTGLVIFIGGIINLTTEITLRLLLTTGPLFVACLAWGWFRSIFENWMKAIISCLLIVLFSSLTLKVILTMMSDVLLEATSGIIAQGDNTLTTAVMIFGFGALGAAVVVLSTKLATSLSGSSVAAAAAGMGMAAGVGATMLAVNTVGKPLSKAAKDAGGAVAGYAGNKAIGVAEKAYNRYQMQQSLRKSSIANMSRLNK